ncbi:hypothetical protein D3C77_322210 [compost metagenome]
MRQSMFILMLFLFVFTSWFIYPALANFQSEFIQSSKLSLNEFGDMYGSLNTLFSGLAFVGVIISIRLQSKELSETRKEMKNQGEQFEEQTRALNKQVFENTFFKLLGFNNEIIQSLSYDRPVFQANGGARKETISGRQVISYFGVVFKSWLKPVKKNGVDHYNNIVTVSEIYSSIHEQHTHILDAFFRNTYQVLSLIDCSNLDAIEKKKYSDIVRAQLSKYEIWFLFCDCIRDIGNSDFKRLLEQFEFFEYMSQESDVGWEDIIKYDVSIFGWTNRHMFEKSLLALVECDETWRKGRKVLAYYDGCSEPVDITNYAFDDIKNRVLAREIIWVELGGV